MRGGKPKPKQVKELKGTYRKHRDNPNAPEPSKELPIAPETFGDRTRQWFEILLEHIKEQGYASASHTEILSLTAMRLAEIEQLTEIVDKVGGPTYETVSIKGEPIVKARPEVAMRNEAMRHAHSLLVEVGLTPSSVIKVSTNLKKPESKWAKFGGKPNDRR